jgi:hypothetical protein
MGLEIVDTDFLCSVHVPPRLGPQRLSLAGVACRFAAEQSIDSPRLVRKP